MDITEMYTDVPATELNDQQATAELTRIKADKGHAYFDGNSPAHAMAVQRVTELYERLHPDKIDHNTGFNPDSPLNRAAEEGIALREAAVEKEWGEAHKTQDALFKLADSLDVHGLYKAIEEHFSSLNMGVSARKGIEALLQRGLGIDNLSSGAQVDVSDSLKKVICEQMLQEWANQMNDRRKQALKVLGKTEDTK